MLTDTELWLQLPDDGVPHQQASNCHTEQLAIKDSECGARCTVIHDSTGRLCLANEKI